MKFLVTGAAGFIGHALCKKLLNEGHSVIGVDNLNAYYDVQLKKDRLAQLLDKEHFEFQRIDIADQSALENCFKAHQIEGVVNLAAQAGVRYSLENPHAYVDSNLVGFVNILEACRHHQVKHLVYASSSSVYGANSKLPFSVQDNVDHPISLYAATKKSNELMAHTYAHLYDLPVTGLRFFTVYGPWGRPDMALFKFVEAMSNNRSIQLYNHGDMIRDFTFIDDIVEGIYRVTQHLPQKDPSWSSAQPNPATSYAPYRLYNIGNSQPVYLSDFVQAIEQALGKKAEIEPMPLQPGDVRATHADVSHLLEDLDFQPKTSIQAGVSAFVDWYQQYYASNHLK